MHMVSRHTLCAYPLKNSIFKNVGQTFCQFFLLCFDLPEYKIRHCSTITRQKNEIEVEYVKKLWLNLEVLFLSQSSSYRATGIIFVTDSSKKHF